MCGFLGWCRDDGLPSLAAGKDRLSAALDLIAHRGPDDSGELETPGAWLGFRRLSILDLSERGHQPMRFGAGRFTLLFNGEIYNYRQLAKELRQHKLLSTGDAEVLGALLLEYPLESVLSMLRGMFAFAWWDAEQRSLVAARDGFGIKPLYYAEDSEGLRFGSELRALAALEDRKPPVNATALGQYLRYGSVQAPDTILQGIRCLPPGHLMHRRNGRTTIQSWFEPQWSDETKWIRSESQQQAQVRDVVLKSIEAHLVSDVPVGAFLSGGLDSTLIAACMKKLGQHTVKAFSVGYEDDVGVPDETDAAERTARHLGCEFIRERITANEMERDLDIYFSSLDQPTGDALNTWLVSRVAAREVKVALSGLGADEWFGGYNFHRLLLLAQRSPAAKACGPFARKIATLLPDSVLGQRAWKIAFHAMGGFGSNVAEAHERGRTVIDPLQVAALMGKPMPQPTHPSVNAHGWLQELLLRETKTYLTNTLLRDNDVTSMAHSLELRVPLVDREVFALAGRLPDEAKLNLRQGKRALRSAFADLLPPWIAQDTQKKTFTLPLMKWMRQPKWRARIHDTVLSSSARLNEHLAPREVRRLVERYESASGNSKASWHLSQPVWMLLVLEAWLRKNVAA